MHLRSIAIYGMACLSASVVFVTVASAQPPPPPGPVNPGNVNDVSVFYDELAPYGEWINIPPYGWVWSPNDRPYDWRPYEEGHWVWTDAGWTWISDEPFGWATCHYGRWQYHPQYSWIWVPGTTWGPAWVAWREGDGWIGWAPLPPDDSIHLGVKIGGFNFHVDSIKRFQWCFVEAPRFCEARLRPHVVRSVRNVNIYDHTRNVTNYTVVNNTIVNNSININTIEKRIGRPVPRYSIHNSSVRQSNATFKGNVVELFRPRLVDTTPRRTPDVLFGHAKSAPIKTNSSEITRRITEERSALQRRMDAENAALIDRQRREAARAPKMGLTSDQLRKYQEREQAAFKEQQERQRKLLERYQDRDQKGKTGYTKDKGRKFKFDERHK